MKMKTSELIYDRNGIYQKDLTSINIRFNQWENFKIL